MSGKSGRVWTKEEMIQNADNWSLAGDVALLNTMKAFSDNLLTETMKINGRIDNLVNSLNDVGLQLDISKNEFQSLRNTQFIENRVYEDDETVDERGNKNEEKQLTEEEKDIILRESVARGLQVMEKYFDKVEVSVSDSEEEGEKGFILQPKDIYADRPWPLLIGSEEWYKKWHVGLIDTPSDSESEKEPEEVYSESSSGDELPKDIYIKGSETSSEFDYSGRQSQSNGPVANSTFSDTASRQKEILHSSDESEDRNSIPAKTPISNQTFAEQLAAKLGTVISQQDDPEINRNPIKKAPTTTKNMGALFSDEPPPLDDSEDTVLPKNAKSGLFSGGTGLFDDDNEGDLFWGQNKTSKVQTQKDENKNSVPSEVDRNENNVVPKVTTGQQNTIRAQAIKGLFDSDESSDDDMFTVPKRQTTKPYIQPFKTTNVPLFDDEPPELPPPQKKIIEGSSQVTNPSTLPPLFEDESKPDVMDESPQRKKPIGGVSIFGGADLFSKDNQPKLTPKSNESTEKVVEKVDESHRPIPTQRQTKTAKVENDEPLKTNLFDDNVSEIPKPDNKPKKISLFDDDTLFDDDDLFKNIVAPRKSNIVTNLFDDLEEQNTMNINKSKGDLFDDASTEQKQKRDASAKIRKNVGLFDSSSDEEDIFNTKKPETTLVKNIEKETLKTSLFDDVSNDSEQTKMVPKHIETQPSTSLFEDSYEEKSGIFSKVKDNTNQEAKDIIREPIEENQTKSNETNVILAQNDEKSKLNLFEESANRTEDIFKGFKDNDENIEEKQLEDSEKKKTNISLFDDGPYDEPDDIFAGFTKPGANKIVDLLKEKDVAEDMFNRGVQNEDGLKVVDDQKVVTEEIVEKDKSEVIEEVQSSKDSAPDLEKAEAKNLDKENETSEFESGQLKKDLFGEVGNMNYSDADVTPKADSQPKSQVNIPSISLFDPTPPPDDDDWDTKSNTSDDMDDNFSYHEELSTQRSSIFDVEPPSLRPDESSGIVRDQNVSRSETLDDSSFYPYASSSRRLSSDIFNEEQSNDNLFVTKNKMENQHQSNLQSIPETVSSPESHLEITPSGDINDFVSNNDSVFEKSSVQKSITNELRVSKKNVSLFGSDDDSNDADDLFKKDEKKGGSVKSALASVETIEQNKKATAETKEEVPIDSSNNVASISERLQNIQQQSEKKEKTTGSPGKIKHNLNINVGALMPGMRSPRLRDIKSQNNLSTDSESSVSSQSFTSISSISVTSSNAKDIIEKPVSFVDDEEKVEVLQSITKDRAKLPLRRRPSTRRGRQAALRKSGIDFSDEKDEVQGDIEEISKKDENSAEIRGISMVFGTKEIEPQITDKEEQKVDQDITKTSLFDEGDNNHIFAKVVMRKPETQDKEMTGSIPEESVKGEIKNTNSKVEQRTEKSPVFEEQIKSKDLSKKSSVFDDDNDNDDDLFQPSTVVKKSIPSEKAQSSLFSDSPDSDGELFGSKTSDLSKKGKEIGKQLEKKKKPLFDDSSSDDDLFGGRTASSKNKKKATVPSVVQKKPMKTVIKKLDNKETDDDPLSALLK